MVEIVAGRVDPGESFEAAARRECMEEVGLSPLALMSLFSFAPVPALSDELMTLFLARVDAGSAPPRAGDADAGEDIDVIRCKIGEAIRMVELNAIRSAPTIIALQWLRCSIGSLRSLIG